MCKLANQGPWFMQPILTQIRTIQNRGHKGSSKNFVETWFECWGLRLVSEVKTPWKSSSASKQSIKGSLVRLGLTGQCWPFNLTEPYGLKPSRHGHSTLHKLFEHSDTWIAWMIAEWNLTVILFLILLDIDGLVFAVQSFISCEPFIVPSMPTFQDTGPETPNNTLQAKALRRFWTCSSGKAWSKSTTVHKSPEKDLKE